MRIVDCFADHEEEEEVVSKPELKVTRTPEDAALREERYQRLLALGVAEYRAVAGSLDGQAYLAARVFHRGV